ncbi:MAG: hypothetical protein WC511_04235 [Candidatus Pacearchaeota archaeon]
MNFSDKKIRVILILEVIGRPPEFLTETLQEMVKKISEEKGVRVVDKKINPPVLMKDQKDFYTSFAEVEVEVENMISAAILMFKYMPAHVEVVSPQNISMTNADFDDILNEVTRRLHGYEEIARIMQNEKMVLEAKLRGLTEVNIPKKTDKKEKSKNKK